MPITLAKMTANTSTAKLDWGEDEVNIVYRPGKVTEKLFAQLAGIEQFTEKTIGPGMADYNATLADIIVSWDVMEGETMFPIDPIRFPELPLMFRMQVVYAIMGDIRPENLAPEGKTKS